MIGLVGINRISMESVASSNQTSISTSSKTIKIPKAPKKMSKTQIQTPMPTPTPMPRPTPTQSTQKDQPITPDEFFGSQQDHMEDNTNDENVILKYEELKRNIIEVIKDIPIIFYYKILKGSYDRKKLYSKKKTYKRKYKVNCSFSVSLRLFSGVYVGKYKTYIE